MRLYSHISVTFIELLVAIVLLSVVILAVNNLNVFSQFHIVSSDRRAKLQNDASRCLEHITKYASGAIGNEAVSGGGSAINAGLNILAVFRDVNGNGLADPPGVDWWVGYTLNTTTHQLSYCDHCSDSTCSVCLGNTENLANDISAFSSGNQVTYVNADITACWDPTAATAACGTSDNPSVIMSTSINLPSVSTN